MGSKYYDSPTAIQVIGCILNNPRLLEQEDKYTFREEDFCNELHKVIFGATYTLQTTGAQQINRKVIENYLAEQYMPDKFWLHRTDSVEKQYEFTNKYKGIEFDIIYYKDENAFENSHDKKDLNKYNLEKQLQAYQDIGLPKGIWLDFKNLTESNKFAAKDTLDKLMSKYKIDKIYFGLKVVTGRR